MRGRLQCPGIPHSIHLRISVFHFSTLETPPLQFYQISLKTNFEHHIRKSWEDGGDSLPQGWRRRIAEGGFNFSTSLPRIFGQNIAIRIGKDISFQHFLYDDRGYLDTVNIVIMIFKGESMMEFILSPQGVQYR